MIAAAVGPSTPVFGARVYQAAGSAGGLHLQQPSEAVLHQPWRRRAIGGGGSGGRRDPRRRLAWAAGTIQAALATACVQGRRPRRCSRARARVVAARAAAGEGSEAGEPSTALSADEVYGILKTAPNNYKAVQLAARLRTAAKEGRKMKGGGTLDARTVDDALDLFLAEGLDGQKAQDQKEEEVLEEEEDMNEAFEEDEDEALGREVFQRASQLGAEGPDQRGEDGVFRPDGTHTMEELQRGIINAKYNNCDRVWSAADKIGLPQPPQHVDEYSDPRQLWLRLPHIAINGMTNCGKSSVLNHLLRWSYASKASSVPGRTKSLDFYCINDRFVLVDFPGYPHPSLKAHMGVAREWTARWKDAVNAYLKMCAKGIYDLRLVLQLQTTRDPASESCVEFSRKIRHLKLPMMLVMTKDDRLKGAHEERTRLARQLKQELNYTGPHLHYTTKNDLPQNRKARKHLQRWIRTGVEARDGEEVRQIMQRVWSNCQGQELSDGAAATGEVVGATAESAPR